MTKFSELGLSERLVHKLDALGHDTPTPIQAEAIPWALKGRDIMGLAQTGTGKTAAFSLPMIERILNSGDRAAPKEVTALVLAPTRELARQITDTLAPLIKRTNLRVGLVVGGMSVGAQAKRLSRGTDILVATPGRLMDHLERGSVSLSNTQFLVLDEADQMLDLGFIHTLRKIAKLLPEDRQTLLFSATMPKQMEEISESYLSRPVKVEVAPQGKVADKIEQAVHFVAQTEKAGLLKEYLAKLPKARSIVFSRTKHGAERLMKGLNADGFNAAAIHGNKSQGQRDRALASFRSGDVQILVATDVAARGIDIRDVTHVFNFDLPNVAENYVHRIGRTARAGAEGEAIAFCAPDEMSDLRGIERLMKLDIPVIGGTAWAHEDAPKSKGRGRRGSSGGGGRGPKPATNAKPARRRHKRRRAA
ncbi:DEAD/DEAH box helicase [Qingshengfaniella alkalisoli]|uniref:DEAD/DEAH box helicase n=1 Tax=Qingshengfaniella alkalisoli TaxID=2599296 RepID=A0A5B8ISJ6_9RHOB|nr:DEAD/DEAH box helicase [Qingshengfaniella alkalisoli]QDY68403.1 DEAD/DEAH box helicase [Qingshengfaniella alkalisoli]